MIHAASAREWAVCEQGTVGHPILPLEGGGGGWMGLMNEDYDVQQGSKF